jgi:hypothetical protein
MNFLDGDVVEVGNFFRAQSVYFMVGNILEQAVLRPHKVNVILAAFYST